MTRQLRGLALAAVSTGLLIVLAAVTFGVTPTLTVIIAAAAIAAGVTLMTRNQEER